MEASGLRRISDRNTIKLSVAIICRNDPEVLRDCLSMIPDAVGDVEHEIIVIDNASTDPNVEMVRSSFPAVRLVENTENLGFPKAANQGIRESAGEYIALLNADILPPPNSLKQLVRHLDENHEVGAVGPQLVGRSGHLQYSGGFAPSPKAVLTELIGYNALMGNRARGVGVRARSSKKVMSVDWLCGASPIIRRQAIDDVGVLDETLFMYADDVDYGLRLRQKGWKLHLVPSVRVIHYGGLSGAKIPETKLLWLGAIFRIAANNLSPLAFKTYGLLLSMQFLSRYVILEIVGAIPGQNRGGRAEVLAHTKDFRKYASAAFRLGIRGPGYVPTFCAELEQGYKKGQETT